MAAQAGLWEVLESKVIPLENVRSALAAVESGNDDVGIVYKTNSEISKKVKNAFIVTAKDAPQISYSSALIKEAKHSEAARKFLEYLQSPDSMAVFEKFGFVVLK